MPAQTHSAVAHAFLHQRALRPRVMTIIAYWFEFYPYSDLYTHVPCGLPVYDLHVANLYYRITCDFFRNCADCDNTQSNVAAGGENQAGVGPTCFQFKFPF